MCACVFVFMSVGVCTITVCMCASLCETLVLPHSRTYYSTAHDIIALINNTPVILLLLLSQEETISDVRNDEAHHVNILQS